MELPFIAVAHPPPYSTPHILKLGDTMTARPLPLFILLYLQWHLQRIAAIAIAREELDSNGESNDDDEAAFDPLEALYDEDERR